MKFQKSLRFILSFVLISLIENSFSQYIIDPFFSELHLDISQNRFPIINAGSGYTGVAGNRDNDNFINCLLNPAAMNIEKKFSFAVEYALREKQTLNYSVTIPEDDKDSYYDQINPDFLIAGAYKINKKITTAAYIFREKSLHEYKGKYYSYDSSTNITTVLNNNESVSQNTFGVSVSYKLNKKLCFGANIFYMRFNGKVENFLGFSFPIRYINATTDFGLFNAQFGVIYTPNKRVSTGLSFTPSVKYNIKWTNSELVSYEPFILPAKVGIGLRYEWVENVLSTQVDINFKIYSRSNFFGESRDINLGLDVKPVEYVTLRIGYFTDNLHILYSGNERDQTAHYFTLGGSYIYKGVSFNASYLNNKIDNEYLDVVMIQFGAGIEM